MKTRSKTQHLYGLLFLAAWEDYPLVVQELLFFEGATKDIRTALNEAAASQNHPLSAEVLSRWASIRGCDPDPDCEALDYAIQHNMVDLMTPLLFFRTNASLKKILTEKLLIRLIEHGQTEALEVFLGYKE